MRTHKKALDKLTPAEAGVWGIAVHEAGHATAAADMGVPFGSGGITFDLMLGLASVHTASVDDDTLSWFRDARNRLSRVLKSGRPEPFYGNEIERFKSVSNALRCHLVVALAGNEAHRLFSKEFQWGEVRGEQDDLRAAAEIVSELLGADASETDREAMLRQARIAAGEIVSENRDGIEALARVILKSKKVSPRRVLKVLGK